MNETPTTLALAPSGVDDGRVKASIENWKRKLLDLTKRNRALNFKVNKVSTITMIDEQPADVFRQLYLQENSMRFKAAPEPDQAKGNAASTTEGGEVWVSWARGVRGSGCETGPASWAGPTVCSQ